MSSAANASAAVPLPASNPVSAPDALPQPDLAPTTRVALWDLPLRVFHWSLLAAVAVAVTTGELGGDWMAWHGRAGITILGLLAFRLGWGVLGSSTSRFTHFAPTPERLRAYLQGRWQGVGHNPLGALSVFALLGLLALQVGTGLFGNDDIAYTGPLAQWLSDERVSQVTGWHRLLAYGLFTLLALHVAAIAFHARVKNDNLVVPMVTGWKAVDAERAAQVAPRTGGGLRPFTVALVLALAAVWSVTLAPWLQPAAAAAPAAAAPAVNASQAAPGW